MPIFYILVVGSKIWKDVAGWAKRPELFEVRDLDLDTWGLQYTEKQEKEI